MDNDEYKPWEYIKIGIDLLLLFTALILLYQGLFVKVYVVETNCLGSVENSYITSMYNFNRIHSQLKITMAPMGEPEMFINGTLAVFKKE